MGTVIIGGLLSSLILTLFLVPMVYDTWIGFFERARRSARWLPPSSRTPQRSPAASFESEQAWVESLHENGSLLLHLRPLFVPRPLAAPRAIRGHGHRKRTDDELRSTADRAARDACSCRCAACSNSSARASSMPNGQINATGRGRTISLTIGSTQATVDGQPQTMDVAPFIVIATTFVPLRFISQALGASVNWNDSTSTVTIAGRRRVGRRRTGRRSRPARLGLADRNGLRHDAGNSLWFRSSRPLRNASRLDRRPQRQLRR